MMLKVVSESGKIVIMELEVAGVVGKGGGNGEEEYFILSDICNADYS